MRYGLCNQTITLYNVVSVGRDGRDKEYRRTVIKGVFFDNSKNYNINKTGQTNANSFNCIIPQNADNKIYVPPLAYKQLGEITNQYTLNSQDRIVLGVCTKEFSVNDTSWASFKADNMAVIRAIDEKYYNGELVHLEVGG